jgi:hypothetical protein
MVIHLLHEISFNSYKELKMCVVETKLFEVMK